VTDLIRARVASALVSKGYFEGARDMIERIDDARLRLAPLSELSLQLAVHGQRDGALEAAQNALGLLDRLRPAERMTAVKRLAGTIDQAAGRSLLVSVVQNAWMSTASATNLASRLLLAKPLVAQKPELSTGLVSSISWIRRFFVELDVEPRSALSTT
jgi:hypothetical protein